MPKTRSFTLTIIVLFLLTLTTARSSLVAAQEPPPESLAPTDLNWGNAKIGATLLRELGYTGAGVEVAVIDTGVDFTHSAFTSYTNVVEIDWDHFERDGKGITVDRDNPTGLGEPYSPANAMDYTGHGTNMAGIVAASNTISNLMGVAPGVKIYSLKIQRLVPQYTWTHTRTVGPSSSLTLDFDFTNEVMSETDVIDAILTWGGTTSCGVLQITAADQQVYDPDQAWTNFSACTNIPFHRREGQWQATIRNTTSQSCEFYLTTRRWQWQLYASEEIARAVRYAADNLGVDVINLSVSVDPEVMEDVIRTAEIEYNAIVVKSAGNKPDQMTGGTRWEITVGATDDSDILADFSAHGPAYDLNTKPDVVAPGVAILTPASQHSFGFVPGLVESVDGTSAAAAHVTGAAALLIEYLTQTTGHPPTVAQVKTLLMGTAVDVGIIAPPNSPDEIKLAKDKFSGSGRIDLYRAINTFLVSGTANNDQSQDLITTYLPTQVPQTPLTTPLRGALYWSLYTPYNAFLLSGGSYTSDHYDTILTTDSSPTPGETRLFGVVQLGAFEADPWTLMVTYPPTWQTVDGLTYGYYYTETNIPPPYRDFTLLAPAAMTNGLRIITYQSGHANQIQPRLYDPNGALVKSFPLYRGVDIKPIATASSIAPGAWTLRIMNTMFLYILCVSQWLLHVMPLNIRDT